MKLSLKGVLFGILLAAMCGQVFAEFAAPEDAIRYRQAVMTVIGEHFGRIAAAVTGQTPYDKKEAEENTVVLRTMAELPWEACLVTGSYKGKTTLKSLAMKEKDKFMAIAQQFESASEKLAEAAESGDQNAVGKQFGEVAKNCKACHTTYRKQ
jgi:cytochrome c556